jgi:magnesium chelatase subunit I
MHYGLLPRANRGIFAVNEIPDLAGKIQVALFNILQEGDIQIKGYPVRLQLDVALVFSANPEDYTARGKIVTPLKDRIGSEIRTHYASTVEEGIEITRQEAWTERRGSDAKPATGSLEIPMFLREIVEQVAFLAREDRRVDKKSGVSQRLPISTLELVVSNAERRALIHDESLVVPRITDLYAALPGITGKLELEYEGELRGADTIVREILRNAVAKVYDKYFSDANTQQIEQYFHLGGALQVDESDSSRTIVDNLKQIQGLVEKLKPVGIKGQEPPAQIVAAAEFLLEGLYAHKKLSRNEERGFAAPEKATRREQRQAAGEEEQQYEDWQNRKSGRRGSFN